MAIGMPSLLLCKPSLLTPAHVVLTTYLRCALLYQVLLSLTTATSPCAGICPVLDGFPLEPVSSFDANLRLSLCLCAR
ncbi:hypothetical protein BCR37DRAFT_377844 [Protomyces lactucae-debilis]|uniref:Uncharacterized protein n=1 Tax=Protomyces lactucae-debilis TaxID=2754530 RepID=A0A1Y2FLW4_PROLT|nr:uncharacterized protein BCR37DRAFT_377844 [Protomyces lactucae-debilis]ORY84929.1 hypothetical protein BCR37DRAFT_377844 [Protomyces lactucae-debilis]